MSEDVIILQIMALLVLNLVIRKDFSTGVRIVYEKKIAYLVNKKNDKWRFISYLCRSEAYTNLNIS